MPAAPRDAQPLLELQRLDDYAHELRLRRAGLPERVARAGHEAELAAVARAREETGARWAALGREERRLEALVADLRARAGGVESRLYSGEVKAIKELEALQHELGEWRRRQGEQEETELALLEEEERLAGEIAALDARRSALEAGLAELLATLGAAEATIDAELSRVADQRAAVAARVEAPVLAHYERLLAAPPLRGRAVARIADGACTGCRATLPVAFASRLQAGTGAATPACPRCGRLLVV